MKGSLVIVAFFALGVLCSYSGMVTLPADSSLSFYALCGLLFCVGLSIGSDSKTLSNFRNLNPRLLLLPAFTIAGTLAGSAVAGLILADHSITDCLAVGSGMGYYSLSSIFITEYKGAELGVIALMVNILREIITLLFAPALSRYFGPLAPITSGGATTMDTTLPIILRSSGQSYMVVSVYHGFVCDFCVPFLVVLMCSI